MVDWVACIFCGLPVEWSGLKFVNIATILRNGLKMKNPNAWSLKNSRVKLLELIKGRESSPEWVLQSTQGNETALKIRIQILKDNQFGIESYRGDSFDMNIHADTRCDALAEFLKNVNIDNISVVEGDEGGHVLGISGKIIPKLYIYSTKKK